MGRGGRGGPFLAALSVETHDVVCKEEGWLEEETVDVEQVWVGGVVIELAKDELTDGGGGRPGQDLMGGGRRGRSFISEGLKIKTEVLLFLITATRISLVCWTVETCVKFPRHPTQ